jgi:hypothetical protein
MEVTFWLNQTLSMIVKFERFALGERVEPTKKERKL